jgi:hypothetical protein
MDGTLPVFTDKRLITQAFMNPFTSVSTPTCFQNTRHHCKYTSRGWEGDKKGLLQATPLLLVSDPVILTDSRRETVG